MSKVTHIGQAPSAQQEARFQIAIDEMIEMGLVVFKGDGTNTVVLTAKALRLAPFLVSLLGRTMEKASPDSYDVEAWEVVTSDLQWLHEQYSQ